MSLADMRSYGDEGRVTRWWRSLLYGRDPNHVRRIGDLYRDFVELPATHFVGLFITYWRRWRRQS